MCHGFAPADRRVPAAGAFDQQQILASRVLLGLADNLARVDPDSCPLCRYMRRVGFWQAKRAQKLN
jgi:hypothetical protein